MAKAGAIPWNPRTHFLEPLADLFQGIATAKLPKDRGDLWERITVIHQIYEHELHHGPGTPQRRFEVEYANKYTATLRRLQTASYHISDWREAFVLFSVNRINAFDWPARVTIDHLFIPDDPHASALLSRLYSLQRDALEMSDELRAVANNIDNAIGEQYSEPRSPDAWEEVFPYTWKTIARRIKEGKIRALMVHSKSWRIHVDDVPQK
jgi:hypothetical protein